MIPVGHCIPDISQEQYRHLLSVFGGQEILRNMVGCPFSCMIRSSEKMRTISPPQPPQPFFFFLTIIISPEVRTTETRTT